MVTWLIFGHKIQGMFSWYDHLSAMPVRAQSNSCLLALRPCRAGSPKMYLQD